jgi:6-pyruvoyl tetrahydropterin synthase/QueD family protein
MHTISKTFDFSAAHKVVGHPKCGRLHGHNYKMTVWVTGPLDDNGMVIDYGKLKELVMLSMFSQLDHRFIVGQANMDAKDPMIDKRYQNEFVLLDGVIQTTAEELAKWCAWIIQDALDRWQFAPNSMRVQDAIRVTQVVVEETDTSSAVWQNERPYAEPATSRPWVPHRTDFEISAELGLTEGDAKRTYNGVIRTEGTDVTVQSDPDSSEWYGKIRGGPVPDDRPMQRAVASRETTASPAPLGAIEALLSERGKTHGDAWIRTGEIISRLPDGYLDEVDVSGYRYVWDVILCKLLRAAHTPHERDHWADVAGYAQLVVNHIDSDGDNRGF